MNREKAINLLRSGPEGVTQFNDWRADNKEEPPFLSAANLRGANLVGANLRFVSLALARLDGADMTGADLTGASVRQGDLFDANLTDALLVNADIRAADLSSCNLANVNAAGADFSGADLNGSNLNHANLAGADFNGTDLRNTDLSAVNLRNARLIGTQMNGARLTNAEFAGTVISCGLDGVTDLDLTIHHLPSPIAVSSILSLTGDTPVVFLRGCGLRREEIEHFQSVLLKPVNYNACFLTYHQADEELANKLHRDLQDSGIRCWKRRHRSGDLEIGESGEIERINCGVKRLILLASESSLNSPSVLREVDWALRQEEFATANNSVLVPLELDDFARNGWDYPGQEKVIARFTTDTATTDWQTNAATYAAILKSLLASLKS